MDVLTQVIMTPSHEERISIAFNFRGKWTRTAKVHAAKDFESPLIQHMKKKKGGSAAADSKSETTTGH